MLIRDGRIHQVGWDIDDAGVIDATGCLVTSSESGTLLSNVQPVKGSPGGRTSNWSPKSAVDGLQPVSLSLQGSSHAYS